MYKERLELAKELLESFKSNREIHEPFVMSFEYETIEALEYIIEQAERVQELEYLLDLVRKRKSNLEKQNKRYREALEGIAESRITIADSFGNIRTAKRALEKEE